MWKWIIGGLLVLLAFVAWKGVTAYKRFTAGGGVSITTIAAPPSRVFASIANADSLSTWMTSGSVRTDRTGALQVGDEVHVEANDSRSSRRGSFTWTITEVRPDLLLAMELRIDTSRRVLAARRDSLAASGDTTMVISSIGSPLFDSVRTARSDSGRGTSSAIAGFGSRMFVSVFRVQAAAELKRLKTRIEGHSDKVIERSP